MSTTLFSLPAELRLHIISFLPECREKAETTIHPYSYLTPNISRVNQQLRCETLPLFASRARFLITLDERLAQWHRRMRKWIAALGDEPGLERVHSLQFSRHWHLGVPALPTHMEGGRAGFYLLVERSSTAPREWTCTTGTYPDAKDHRDMRMERLQWLREYVSERLERAERRARTGVRNGLLPEDIEYIVTGMNFTAYNPGWKLPTYRIGSETGRFEPWV